MIFLILVIATLIVLGWYLVKCVDDYLKGK